MGTKVEEITDNVIGPNERRSVRNKLSWKHHSILS